MPPPQHPVLLVVADDPGVLGLVERLATQAGFEAVACVNGQDALDQLTQRHPDVAMVDLRMPELNGLEVLRDIKSTAPNCEVILMTGFAEVDSAVEAVKLGARDYLTKPFDFQRLGALLMSIRDEANRRRTLIAVESHVARQLEFCGMIGRSPVMQETFSLVRRLAPHIRVALITGETGTGKELIGRALHATGPRQNKRFVTLNCSAVVETLFESELFGHVRGAFTGAIESKAGLIETADGGTLFLDELGELPLSVQTKLLRVLEQGEVQRVGSPEVRRVNVCVIAATNRDLRAEVAAGRFRSDLYYRLNVVEVPLPPLRNRREDIPYLTASFLKEFAGRMRKTIIGVTPHAERMLLDAPWEGNVRELRNAIERACILAETSMITERELAGLPVSQQAAARAMPEPHPMSAATPDDSLSSLEREHILRMLQQAGGNKKAAAQLLGVSRRALYRRLERHGFGRVIEHRKPGAHDDSD